MASLQQIARAKDPVAIGRRFWSKVDKSGPIASEELGPCWIWTAGTGGSFGYGIMNVGGSNGFNLRAHRFSWSLEYGPIDKGLCVLHRCDNPLCVRPAHLFLGTRADNIADMDRKGRRVTPNRREDRNGRARLTPDQVREIRLAASVGAKGRHQAKLYGMAETTISAIVNGKLWGYVT